MMTIASGNWMNLVLYPIFRQPGNLIDLIGPLGGCTTLSVLGIVIDK